MTTNAEVRLSDDDRKLLEEVRRIGQTTAALMRGVLAQLPRPTPAGDWGRSSAPAEPTRQGGPGPQLVEAPRPAEEQRAISKGGRGGGAPRRIDWPPEARMRALYEEHRGNISAIARRLKRPYLQVYRHIRYQIGLTRG